MLYNLIGLEVWFCNRKKWSLKQEKVQFERDSTPSQIVA